MCNVLLYVVLCIWHRSQLGNDEFSWQPNTWSDQIMEISSFGWRFARNCTGMCALTPGQKNVSFQQFEWKLIVSVVSRAVET